MRLHKIHYILGSTAALIALMIAIEKWYAHPTLGRGLSAFAQAAVTLDIIV